MTTTRTIALVNPPNERPGDPHKYRDQKWLFSFGAYWTQCVVWADHLENALEIAADWLASHNPGHIVTEEEILELCKEEAADRELDWSDVESDDELGWMIHDAATTDLTYTESGYLTSHEWFAREIDRAEMQALQADGATFERA